MTEVTRVGFERAALLRACKMDLQALADARFTGDSAELVACRIKDATDRLAELANEEVNPR